MITNFTAKNFRSYKSVNIEMGKITLLLGKNSSGKSSIIQGLLCLFQSENFPNNLTLNGKFVSMGGFKDIILNHDVARSVELGCAVKHNGQNVHVGSEWTNNTKHDQPILKSLKISSSELDIALKKQDGIFELTGKCDLSWIFKENYGIMFPKILGYMAKMFHENPADEKNKITKEDADALSKEFEGYIKNPVVDVTCSAGSLTEIIKLTSGKMSVFSNFLYNRYRDILRSKENEINYIGSIRDNPKRFYRLDHPGSMKVGRSGENSSYQILNWSEGKADKLNILAEIGNQLGLFRDIKAIHKRGGEYEVKLKVDGTSFFTNICDVGFGVSQILPIITADLQLNNNSTLMLSQPEIHLHPSAQAELGDYFVANCTKRGKRYIIETHSEYLVNRIRKLIATKKIKTDDVNVFYMDDGVKDLKDGIHRIRFLENGQISNAPKDYFETYMCDVMGIAIGEEK